jgi:hypothetical protein
MAQPIRDALVYREVSADGSVWDIKRIAQRHVAAHLEGGWTVLITASALRAIDIEAVYESDRDRPFNPLR